MCIVAVGDSADRMTEDLDRRLRNVLVIIRCTSLAEILENLGLWLVGLQIEPWFDTGQLTEFLKLNIRTSPSGFDCLVTVRERVQRRCDVIFSLLARELVLAWEQSRS